MNTYHAAVPVRTTYTELIFRSFVGFILTCRQNPNTVPAKVVRLAYNSVIIIISSQSKNISVSKNY